MMKGNWLDFDTMTVDPLWMGWDLLSYEEKIYLWFANITHLQSYTYKKDTIEITLYIETIISENRRMKLSDQVTISA